MTMLSERIPQRNFTRQKGTFTLKQQSITEGSCKNVKDVGMPEDAGNDLRYFKLPFFKN